MISSALNMSSQDPSPRFSEVFRRAIGTVFDEEYIRRMTESDINNQFKRGDLAMILKEFRAYGYNASRNGRKEILVHRLFCIITGRSLPDSVNCQLKLESSHVTSASESRKDSPLRTAETNIKLDTNKRSFNTLGTSNDFSSNSTARQLQGEANMSSAANHHIELVLKTIQGVSGRALQGPAVQSLSESDILCLFKLQEIKCMLREFQIHGYRTSLQGNKHALANQLFRIVIGVEHPQNRQLEDKNLLGPRSEYLVPSKNGESSDCKNIKATQQASTKGENLGSPPGSGNVTKNLSNGDQGSANTLSGRALGEFMHIHDEILQWGCFPSENILDAIRKRLASGNDPGLICQDLIVNDLVGGSNIIMSEEEKIAEEAEIQRQFEEDMDRAIFESESGRDHIQECKKARRSQLKSDISCRLGDAIEFQNSFLLGKRKDVNPGTSTYVVRNIVEILDEVAPSTTASNFQGSSNGTSSQDSGNKGPGNIDVNAVQQLREIAFSILDLEMKSHKWYQDRSLAYFVKLSQRISDSVSSVFSFTSGNDFKRALMGYIYGERNQNLLSLIKSVVTTLQDEAKLLERHLYSLHSSSSIPQAFLDCDPDQVHEAKYCLEDDGFEIL